MKEVVTVRFLGQCVPRNFGGIACYAYIIRNKEGHLLNESCGLAAEPNSPSSTNSVANYTALIRALEWLIKNHYRNDIIKVYGNSKLVISQVNEKEIEELSVLAYIEAKTKILQQSGSGLNNSNDKNRQELKKKLFSTAAELMMAAAK